MTGNPETSLAEWGALFSGWLMDAALPLWWEKGADRENGGFVEVLNFDGTAPAIPRRARVQSRQSYVFSLAGKMGWKGPWSAAANHGLHYLQVRYHNENGLFHTLVGPDGSTLNDAVVNYDQAFALLAAASLYEQEPGREDLKTFALNILSKLEKLRRHDVGGFREVGPQPFLSNPHMHLLEAALAWIDADGDPVWHRLSNDIVELCLVHFIDPDRLVLREYFDAAWRALPGELGNSIEPGHQFEWAWLLERWARRRDHDGARKAARVLFEAGVRGVDPVRNVAIDEISDDLMPRRNTARLWPQTERLKAALLLADGAEGGALESYEVQAYAAAHSLWGYLQTPLCGLWRDKMLPDGSYFEEPAPASSLYHIICAVACLRYHQNSA